MRLFVSSEAWAPARSVWRPPARPAYAAASDLAGPARSQGDDDESPPRPARTAANRRRSRKDEIRSRPQPRRRRGDRQRRFIRRWPFTANAPRQASFVPSCALSPTTTTAAPLGRIRCNDEPPAAHLFAPSAGGHAQRFGALFAANACCRPNGTPSGAGAAIA